MTLDLAAERAAYQQLLETARTLIISSVDAEQQPFISYAPFVRAAGKFYVYISKIAEHYAHLERHPRVHIMLLADEGESPNLFARLRVRYDCDVTRLADQDDHEALFDSFAQRFNPSLLRLLRTLDFSLFELSPRSGRFVSGFGKAFDVDGTSKFDHVVVSQRRQELADQQSRSDRAAPGTA